jgi:hypothetical protein
MKQGIAPALLLSQVENTAAWAMDTPAGKILRAGADPNDLIPYLHVLLSAHYLTVATFVPTDVDTRIRHHLWWSLETEEQLLRGLDVVDEVASWDPRVVSERVVRDVCGHQGEWLSVWAGALGRAIALDANEARDRALSRIDEELEREAAIFEATKDPLDVLRCATVLAHNLGDLSRVVEAWPRSVNDGGLRQRLVRLGHEGGRFYTAGAINKPIMAPENDRFLALRPARPLRKSRKLLLPIAPFFDEWGEMIARTELLDDDERGEIVAALVETHTRNPQQLGCLRALAGFDRAHKGGVNALEDAVPARQRKLLRAGALREQIGISRAHFEARMIKKLESVRTTR